MLSLLLSLYFLLSLCLNISLNILKGTQFLLVFIIIGSFNTNILDTCKSCIVKIMTFTQLNYGNSFSKIKHKEQYLNNKIIQINST